MKAVVYHGPGQKAWEEVPDPVIVDDTDAIVRVDAVTICGTDLHILKGDVPAVTDGRILGHEAVGTVESVGSGVKNVAGRRPGAGLVHHRVRRVPVLPRGQLRPVPRRRRLDPRPQDRRHPGRVRAGAVRRHLHLPGCRPGVSDEELLMLADILPTGYEVGVLNGHVQPGDVVAVVGAGPIGLSAIMGARLFSPSHVVAIDLADSRLEAAKQFGADIVGQQRPRGSAGGRPGPDRRARCRRRHRGRRRAGDVRARRRARPTRWPHRQHRRARRAGHAAPRGAVDPQRHHHHRPGRHLLDADPAAAGPGPSGRRRTGSSRTTSRLDQFDEAYDVFARAADTGAAQGRPHPDVSHQGRRSGPLDRRSAVPWRLRRGDG